MDRWRFEDSEKNTYLDPTQYALIILGHPEGNVSEEQFAALYAEEEWQEDQIYHDLKVLNQDSFLEKTDNGYSLTSDADKYLGDLTNLSGTMGDILERTDFSDTDVSWP